MSKSVKIINNEMKIEVWYHHLFIYFITKFNENWQFIWITNKVKYTIKNYYNGRHHISEPSETACSDEKWPVFYAAVDIQKDHAWILEVVLYISAVGIDL